jgi:Cu(I)/Ag(I) efflux system membrane protein CusA/SilA
MIERLIDFSARQRFLVFVVVAFMLAWGLWALVNSPLDAIPDLSDTQVIVFTEWPGRSPDLVEDQITYPIVSSLVAAPEVRLVRGLSDFGFSYVYVIFEDGTDIYWARSRVLEYLSEIEGRLPDEVNPTLGPDATAVGWVFQYALVDETGQNDLQQLRSFQDWTLRYALEAVEGVAEVASIGGFVKQYQVNVDPNRLLTYDIPLQRVIDAIRESNNDVGGKSLEIATTEYMVRGRGYVDSLEDLEQIPVDVGEGGTPVLVRDLGTVQLGPDMRRGVAELDGRGEAVGGIVVMRYGEDVLGVIERVKARLAEIEPSLPPGVEIVTTYDRSGLILRAVDTVRGSLVEEMIVVSLMIIIFLLHFRTSLVPIVVLPIAVILSFIPMYYMGLTVNIMSLGGIAVAIGAMVDASIVLVENAHKKLEHWEQGGKKGSRTEVLIASFQEVGRTIFFALLVITVSFLPVFTLQAQEGRLFRPLAYTKTFSMAFAAILAVTLVPALAVLLIRGHIRSEQKHPISRLLFALYSPVLDFVVRYQKTVILAALVLVLTTIPVFFQLGSEFMPPLNEGTILFMPTAMPGMPIAEASRILQVQDRVLAGIPEVERVFGKIGRSTTPTDSAPLSMAETTVLLRDQREWRTVTEERWHSEWAPGWLRGSLNRFWPETRPMSWNELIAEIDPQVKMPGMANIWWMPVQTRTEMLNTGIRSNLGIKVFGSDLAGIETVALEIERALEDVEGTRSAFADRVTGGYFLDFVVNRAEAARYGLTVQNVDDIIEAAVGGKNVSYTVEGRERYPINVRYLRELRDDPARLAQVYIPTPTGAQVPISMLADIRFTTGPPMIRGENAQLVGYVFVDVADADYEGYVERAQAVVADQVTLPTGYRLEWAGQYQYLQRMKDRLRVVVPLTLFLVFFLLYMSFRDWRKTAIVLLAIPFSLVGAVWLLYLLDYNMSVAVWVGMIALAGLDAETGSVMLLYLDLAYKKAKGAGRMRNFGDLNTAIHEGAVRRIRPKAMTVGTTMIGLMPILWASSMDIGADVMKRIAAPMVGGLVTSFVLELTIYPAIFALWKRTGMEGWGALWRPAARPDSGDSALATLSPIWRGAGFVSILVLSGTLGLAWMNGTGGAFGSGAAAGDVFHRESQGGVEVTLRHPAGAFGSGANRFGIELADMATGEPLAASGIGLNLFMPAMGTMQAMSATADVVPAGAGQWNGSIDVPMAGEWQVTVDIEGPEGASEVRFPTVVR